MAARLWTVPNQLTLLRLAFVPFFNIFVLYEHYAWAFAVLIAAGVSDGLDGLLARRLNQKTPLGAYLDPIADKLLLSSAFVSLAIRGKVESWLTILVLGRDVLILIAAGVILLVIGYRPFPPSLYGKLTTLTQIVLILLVVTGNAFGSDPLAQACLYLSYLVAALTVFSGLHYSVFIARQLSHSPPTRH